MSKYLCGILCSTKVPGTDNLLSRQALPEWPAMPGPVDFPKLAEWPAFGTITFHTLLLQQNQGQAVFAGRK